MANGTLNFTIKGIHIGIKVIWNYAPPTNGGDTFTSIKKGTKATLKTVQNKKNGFTKELYIQKEQNTDVPHSGFSYKKPLKNYETLIRSYL